MQATGRAKRGDRWRQDVVVIASVRRETKDAAARHSRRADPDSADSSELEPQLNDPLAEARCSGRAGTSGPPPASHPQQRYQRILARGRPPQRWISSVGALRAALCELALPPHIATVGATT